MQDHFSDHDYRADVAQHLLEIARRRNYIDRIRHEKPSFDYLEHQKDILREARLFRLRYACNKAVLYGQMTEEEKEEIIKKDMEAQKTWKSQK